AREDTIKKKVRAKEEYYTATQELVYDKYEGRNNDIDSDLRAESMLECVDAVENQENPLLDEVGDPPRPSRFITEAIEEEEAYP
ncbi:hypothetical protein GW17_00026985, partial [Ensete ventricosum]